jgi:hypothetical protein
MPAGNVQPANRLPGRGGGGRRGEDLGGENLVDHGESALGSPFAATLKAAQRKDKNAST